ncbi:MAG: hypothetical protein JWP44_5145 [Mucilaginibacter sp.]|nr:hypothetical protein [Mucilaginibacter sp.]
MIPGTSSVAHLEENMQAAKLEFTDEVHRYRTAYRLNNSSLFNKTGIAVYQTRIKLFTRKKIIWSDCNIYDTHYVMMFIKKLKLSL